MDRIDALIQELRAFHISSILVGRISTAATGRDAGALSRDLVNNPKYFAQSASVQKTIPLVDLEALVKRGATREHEVQRIRVFKDERGTTFSVPCATCERWIWCGHDEHSGTCACGKQKYEITFDGAPDWKLEQGWRCMNCGEPSGLTLAEDARNPWHAVNPRQQVCNVCFHMQHVGPWWVRKRANERREASPPASPSSRRDDFSAETIRRVGERVGLLCSNPQCRAATKGPHSSATKATNIGQACHIEAAAEGGPRFNASQSQEERKAIENAIWLCSNCAMMIDNDWPRYSVELLRTWRAEAEADALERLGRRSSPSTAPDSGPSMSEPARSAMNRLVTEYVKASFPNHRVWIFSFPIRDPIAGEIRALGFIEYFGTRRPDGHQGYRLTDAGQRWVMRNRPEMQSAADSVSVERLPGISPPAHALLQKVLREYRKAGSPPLHMIAWDADSEEEAAAFVELHGADLMEQHTMSKWRLTQAGRAVGMS